MNEERLKNELQKMNSEEVDMIVECSENLRDGDRAGRILSRVYAKTGVRAEENYVFDETTSARVLPPISKHPILHRVALTFAAALIVFVFLVPVSIAVIKNNETVDPSIIEDVVIETTVGVYAEKPTGQNENNTHPATDANLFYRLSDYAKYLGEYREDLDLTPEQLQQELDRIRQELDRIGIPFTHINCRIVPLPEDAKTYLDVTFEAKEENAVLTRDTRYCFALSVKVGEGIVKIKGDAFKDFAYLHSVTLPASLREIGDGAFDGCTSLIHISVSPENPVYKVEGNKLIEKETGKVVVAWQDVPSVVIKREDNITI